MSPGSLPFGATQRQRPAFLSAEPAVMVGGLALLAALVGTVIAPPSLIAAVLGFVTVAGLSRDRRLGVVGASLLAIVAVPFGRAAENGLATIGDIPVRFHDGAILAAVLLGLATVRRLDLRATPVRILAAWAAVGVVALAIGVLGDNAMRDVLRDARWWYLYLAGILAIWVRTPRQAVVRGLLFGAIVFAVAILVTAALPAFDGALKDRSLAYDWGRLRLQYSNSVFLVVAIPFFVDRVLRRPRWLDAALLGLLTGTVVLSLTRASIAAMLGGILVALAIPLLSQRLGGRPSGLSLPTLVKRWALAIAIVGGAFVVSVGVVTLAEIASLPPSKDGNPTVSPADRLLFQDPTSGVGAIERGRIATYRTALGEIRESPIVGLGLGELVPIPFTFGGSQPATPGMQPGVDNAFLTVALKAGVIGAAVLALFLGWPLIEALRRRRDPLLRWFLPGWLGLLALSMTQSFASSGYAPFGVGLLAVLLLLRPRAPAMAPAKASVPSSTQE